jgi:LysR family transcriptional regulator, carnitine catabolism transcriptional activator
LQQSQKARELDGHMRGQLIVASLMSISHRVLPAALVLFREKHPKMHVQIREGLTSAVQDDVRSGIADFGIGNANGLADGLVAESIVNEACYVVMPRRHRFGGRSFVSLKDIGDEPMISMPTDSGLRRTLDIAANDRGVVFNHSIVTNQFSSLFDFVSRGLGLAIVPASALAPSSGSSITVKPLRPTITRRIGILRLAEKSLMPASQAFLDIFQPRFLAATGRRRGRGNAGQ